MPIMMSDSNNGSTLNPPMSYELSQNSYFFDNLTGNISTMPDEDSERSHFSTLHGSSSPSYNSW